METIEELFKTEYKKIDARRSGINRKEETLKKKIDIIKRELIATLKRYQFSSRINGQIESKLDELKNKMLKLNNGKTDQLVEGYINDLKREQRTFQENDRQEDKKDSQDEVKRLSQKLQESTKQRGDKNREDKNYHYIEESVYQTFKDIEKNIDSYIQINKIPGVVVGVSNVLLATRKKTVNDIKNEYNRNNNEVSAMLKTEIEKFCGNVKDTIAKQQDKTPQQPKPGILLGDWYINEQKKAEINAKSAELGKKALEAQNNPKKGKGSLALPKDVIL